jgi:hypothetical protein
MPDIKEKIEDFIDVIFFGNSKGEILSIDRMHFDWSKNKRDLLHLFFIVYSNEEKLKQLNNYKIETLLDFAKNTFEKINPCNYILYKLLKFFPLSKNEIDIKNKFIFIKDILYDFITNGKCDENTRNEFKRFYSFLNTLPKGDDFNSQLKGIRDIYWDNDLPKSHDEREAYSINFSLLISQLKILRDNIVKEAKFDDNKAKKVIESWWNIKKILLDPIISFYRGFNDFFKPYPYFIYNNQIDGTNQSLIDLYEFIDDFIYKIEQKNKDIGSFNKAIIYIEFIDEKFGSEGKEFRSLFTDSTVKYKIFKEEFLQRIYELPNKVSVNDKSKINFNIHIPKTYYQKLIIEEIIKNLSWYSDDKQISILIYLKEIGDKKYQVIEIENSFGKKVREFSSNEGLNCLNLLSNSSIFDFKYSYKVNKELGIFKQFLNFKL